MRNTGWYIPYYRKPRKKGKPEQQGTATTAPEIARSDEQLETVRQRWIERHRRTLRALRTLHLSMGSDRADVQARYDALHASGAVPSRDLEDAYRYLSRTLLPAERRRRRTHGTGSSELEVRATVATLDVGVNEAAVTVTDDLERLVAVDVDVELAVAGLHVSMFSDADEEPDAGGAAEEVDGDGIEDVPDEMEMGAEDAEEEPDAGGEPYAAGESDIGE